MVGKKIVAAWDWIVDHWPLVRRSTFEGVIFTVNSERETFHWLTEESRKRHEKDLAEAHAKAGDVVRRLVHLQPNWDSGTGCYQLVTAFDRQMMEEASRFRDASMWRYIAQRAAYEIERELKTMNFANFAQYAHDNARGYAQYPHNFCRNPPG